MFGITHQGGYLREKNVKIVNHVQVFCKENIYFPAGLVIY